MSIRPALSAYPNHRTMQNIHLRSPAQREAPKNTATAAEIEVAWSEIELDGFDDSWHDSPIPTQTEQVTEVTEVAEVAEDAQVAQVAQVARKIDSNAPTVLFLGRDTGFAGSSAQTEAFEPGPLRKDLMPNPTYFKQPALKVDMSQAWSTSTPMLTLLRP